jgi:hypothetical protein
MIMRTYMLSSCLLLLVVTSGCATITRGTTDTLIVESDPAGAEVQLSNGMSGKTPTSFKLPRSDSVVVKIKKEGYEPLEINVTPQVSGAGGAGMAGNVLLGGLIGAAVDAGSGAMNDLKPNPVTAKLTAVDGNFDIQTSSAIETRLKKLARLRKARLISSSEYRHKRSEVLNQL